MQIPLNHLVAEGDEVGGMDMVLDVVDGFDGQDVDYEVCRFLESRTYLPGYISCL